MKRRIASLARVLSVVLLASVSGGCFFGGATPPEQVTDPGIVRFADRIDRFYRALENTPLDLRLTFEDDALRGFFANEADFSDYYAGLAGEIRAALFRNSTAYAVEVDAFRFPSEGLAVVDVRFRGRHRRRLRFGELELKRQDTWRLQDGRWVVSPAKL